MPVVQPSTRIAFGFAWGVYCCAVFLAWRKIMSVPDGNVNGLLVATVAGAFGLALLGAWLQDHGK